MAKPRYTVEDHGNGTFVVDNLYVGRIFGGDHWIQTGKLDLAEAHIFAWAANAMTDGFTLAAYKGGTRTDSILSRTYTGPTEGIAP